MSALEIQPEYPYVKGGLSKMFGIDLLRPALKIWYRKLQGGETGIQDVS
jgi:hypothetical protein